MKSFVLFVPFVVKYIQKLSVPFRVVRGQTLSTDSIH